MTDDYQLRLPRRLFSGSVFQLPVKRFDGHASGVRLQFDQSFLTDESIQKLVLDEYKGDGFEARERQLLLEVLEPGSVFFDIGAHFGIYSLYVAANVSSVRCIAVEPNPTNYEVLSENIELNGLQESVHGVDVALGSNPGMGFLRSNTSMGHHLVREEGSDHSGTRVGVRTLDQIVELAEDLWPLRSDFWAKIDTEGREREVLAGARKSLSERRFSGFVWEYRVGPLTSPWALEVLEVLQGHGYQSYFVSRTNILSVLDPRFGSGLDYARADSPDLQADD